MASSKGGHSAVGLLGGMVEKLSDAMANIRANASDKDGLTQQEERAIEKVQAAAQLLQTASQMLTGTQHKSKPGRVG